MHDHKILIENAKGVTNTKNHDPAQSSRQQLATGHFHFLSNFLRWQPNSIHDCTKLYAGPVTFIFLRQVASQTSILILNIAAGTNPNALWFCHTLLSSLTSSHTLLLLQSLQRLVEGIPTHTANHSRVHNSIIEPGFGSFATMPRPPFRWAGGAWE